MSIGFNLTHYGPVAHEPDGIARFAREAEKLGATSLWVGDRLLAPLNPSVGYLNYDYFPAEFRTMQDPFAALTVAAVVTERVRLGTGTVNSVWYPPPVLARALTSIDVISHGRLEAGFGIGWNPEEALASGVPFAERGARIGEILDVLEAFWTTNPVEYHGKFYEIPESHHDLKPFQRPRPPIHLAAFGPKALRRVGERADGWLMLLGFPPIPAMREAWDLVRRAAEDAGRDPQAIRKILRINVDAGTSPQAVADMVKNASRELEPDETFVDFAYVATCVDHAIELTGRVLEYVTAG
jgi:probable F420-dependent oxidoreductase